MSTFFVIEPADGKMFGRKWAYADRIEPIYHGEAEHCPICGRPVSGMLWIPPHRIKLSSAKPEKWGDFLWGAGFPLMVSGRFKEVYEREGLTGIAEFSQIVEVVRMGTLKSGEFLIPPPVYYLIQVHWGGANQDDSASGFTHERSDKIKCPYCRSGVSWRKQDRVVIEESSWNHADIFKPRNAPVSFMVSERFKQVAEEHQFTNIWFIPAEKYAYDERRPGSTGGLSWYVND
jgi:hypothetical protein